MRKELFSRRDFSRLVGKSFALALAAPHVRTTLDSRHKEGALDNSIRLNFNESPYGPSPRSLEVLAACGRIAARYPDAAYARMLDALAQMHGVNRENILLGCGSTEILRVADMAYLSSGKNVVVAEPTFEAVLEYARITRADAVKIPLTADHRHDLPRMAAACTSKTGVVYVCNPNNPTATIVTRNELAEFIERMPPATLILVDEAYCHFADDPRYASAIEWAVKRPNLIVARTFSKIYGMAGMRLGYAVGAKETIAVMREYLLQDNGNAAVLAAALVGLSDQSYVDACRSKLNATRQWLCNELAKDGTRFIPSQANFVMIDMGSDVRPLVEKFRSRNILVGRRFASMSNWLRVTIGTQLEMETFIAALRAISDARALSAA